MQLYICCDEYTVLIATTRDIRHTRRHMTNGNSKLSYHFYEVLALISALGISTIANTVSPLPGCISPCKPYVRVDIHV